MAGNPLSGKQEIFAQNLFAGMSQAEAYKNSFYADNMTKNTIATQASKMAKNPAVKARVEELRNELKERNMVTAEKVLAELGHIAFDDVKNYLDFSTEKTVVEYEEDTPIFEYRTVVNMKNSDAIDTRNIQEISIASNGTFKFKLYPKDNALIQLGKHLGLFNEKLEVTGKDGGPVVIEDARKQLATRLIKLYEGGADSGSDRRAI